MRISTTKILAIGQIALLLALMFILGNNLITYLAARNYFGPNMYTPQEWLRVDQSNTKGYRVEWYARGVLQGIIFQPDYIEVSLYNPAAKTARSYRLPSQFAVSKIQSVKAVAGESIATEDLPLTRTALSNMIGKWVSFGVVENFGGQTIAKFINKIQVSLI